MVIWRYIAGFLLIGYLSMARSFAYLGVPPVFVGELALVTFLLLKPRVALGTWAASLLRPSPLNLLGLTLFAFMAYGVWQVGRGVFNGVPLVQTLKFFVFNYYALYLFFGLWIALHAPDHLRGLVRAIAWVNGIYGLCYIVALRYVTASVPGTEVPLFSPPTGQVVVVLGLLCFERDLRAVWFILVLNIVITLVWQVRAEWLGLAVGCLAWGLLTGRLGRVVAIGLAGIAAIGLFELAGIQLAGRSGDAATLSENLARVIAPIDLELAKEFSPNAAYHAGTARWRELWWERIWLSVHSTTLLEAFGHGYGFDLFGLAPGEVRAGQEDRDVRTPHSGFLYALGYTGWIGVALFAAFQYAVVKMLWRAYRVSGQPVGVTWWAMGLAMAMFQESFETPFRAIPFYLLIGLAMAPALRSQGEREPLSARTHRFGRLSGRPASVRLSGRASAEGARE